MVDIDWRLGQGGVTVHGTAGRTVTVPLPTDDPLHRSGIIGLRDLAGVDAVPIDSPVRRRGLFGLTPSGA